VSNYKSLKILRNVLVFIFIVMIGNASAVSAAPLEVYVSIPPQAYITERIGIEHVNVKVLLQPGQDPHTFEITPQQIMALGKMKLFFEIGMPFERQLINKIRDSHRNLAIINTADGIKKRAICTHHHHHSEINDINKLDPHIWLSPPLIKIITSNITNALQQADPAHSDEYSANLDSFIVEIDALHAQIGELLKPFKGRSFYVFHPAFGYFADTYGLKQVAVEMEGKSPTPKQLNRLIKQAQHENVKVIFVQPQFDAKSAQAIAEAIGGAVIPLNSLEKDVLGNLEDIAQKIEKALEEWK